MYVAVITLPDGTKVNGHSIPAGTVELPLGRLESLAAAQEKAVKVVSRFADKVEGHPALKYVVKERA